MTKVDSMHPGRLDGFVDMVRSLELPAVSDSRGRLGSSISVFSHLCHSARFLLAVCQPRRFVVVTHIETANKCLSACGEG